MTTPDFEEWLERQDIPVEDTLDQDEYIEYLKEEFGFTGGTLDVARNIWAERYNILPELGIKPFEWHTTIAGERYIETRYGIEGLRGAFGRESMLNIALDIARAKELFTIEAMIVKVLKLRI